MRSHSQPQPSTCDSANIEACKGPGPFLLNASETAKALAISERTLWALTASGQVPHLRIGRCLRYDSEDLRRWVDAKKKGGDAQ